jgi:hypothetical protein
MPGNKEFAGHLFDDDYLIMNDFVSLPGHR